MKKIVNQILATKGYEIRSLKNHTILPSIIKEKLHSDFFFIQIGANDGVSFDPIYESVKAYELKGILIEPVPEYFNKLKLTYSNIEGLRFLNFAIADSEDIELLKIFKANSSFTDWRKGLASTNKENLIINGGLEEKDIEVVDIKSITLSKLLDQYEVANLDLLVIDTEGYDYKILSSFPWEKFVPKIIHFEHNFFATKSGMSKSEILMLFDKFLSLGYKISMDSTDCTVYL